MNETSERACQYFGVRKYYSGTHIHVNRDYNSYCDRTLTEREYKSTDHHLNNSRAGANPTQIHSHRDCHILAYVKIMKPWQIRGFPTQRMGRHKFNRTPTVKSPRVRVKEPRITTTDSTIPRKYHRECHIISRTFKGTTNTPKFTPKLTKPYRIPRFPQSNREHERNHGLDEGERIVEDSIGRWFVPRCARGRRGFASPDERRSTGRA